MVSNGVSVHPWSAGDIKLSARTEAEDGWLKCDGASYPVVDHVNLHLAIGYKFGGSGANFNVPNFARSVPVGVGGAATGELGNAVGNVGGEETHRLQPNEMVPLAGNAASGSGPRAGNYSGQGAPFNIMQPSVVVSYFIKT